MSCPFTGKPLLWAAMAGLIFQRQLYSTAVVPNLGPPDVLGLQLPEILASRGGGEGLWEL